MKKALLILLILVIGIVGFYWYKFSHDSGGSFEGDKAPHLKAHKHTAEFNSSLTNMMTAYFSMKDAFVEADTIAIKASCAKMVSLADSLKMDELKKDTSGIYETTLQLLNDIKSNAVSLLTQTKLEEMRLDFKQLNEQLYSFLKSIGYEGQNVYWQNCPMAFGEGKEANWISNTEEIVNPYLGKHHPEFKGTMLHCGEVKDSIKAQ